MALTTISKGRIEATIDSAGAQLMSLKLDGKEYLWQRDEKYWPRCAPVLFPIVGNLRNDRADSAQGEVRFGRHGLARNYEHEVIEALEDTVTYELVSNDDTRAKFPFDFKLNMTYRIVGDSLERSRSRLRGRGLLRLQARVLEEVDLQLPHHLHRDGPSGLRQPLRAGR